MTDAEQNSTKCEKVFDGATICSEIYNCCDCGGSDCGCAYCWSCNACDTCKEEDSE